MSARPIDTRRIGYAKRNPSEAYLKRASVMIVAPIESTKERYKIVVRGPTRPNGTRSHQFEIEARFASLERLMIATAQRYRIPSVNVSLTLRASDQAAIDKAAGRKKPPAGGKTNGEVTSETLPETGGGRGDVPDVESKELGKAGDTN